MMNNIDNYEKNIILVSYNLNKFKTHQKQNIIVQLNKTTANQSGS